MTNFAAAAPTFVLFGSSQESLASLRRCAPDALGAEETSLAGETPERALPAQRISATVKEAALGKRGGKSISRRSGQTGHVERSGTGGSFAFGWT